VPLDDGNARMRLGAFILTYNRPEDLGRSLESLLSQTRPPDCLLVVDNAQSEQTADLVRGWGDARLLYEATPGNLGSAGGTEYGNRRLAEMGFDLIYNGDDDNPPRTPDTIEILVRLIQDHGADGAGTVGAHWDWTTGRIRRFADEELAGPMEVDFIGGDHKLVLRREVVVAGGIPDGDLFFGYPDLEHCLRLRKAGYRLMIDGSLMKRYRQMVGKIDFQPVRSVVPRRSRQALWRNYYTTRNYIFMMRNRFARPDLGRREAARAIARSAASWLRGPGFGAASTYYHLRGIWDGYRGRRGRTILPRAKVNG